MAYKCLNKLAPDCLSSCISKPPDRRTRELQNSVTDLLIPHMKTSYGQKSFAFRGAKEWNNLDLRTKLAPSVHCFKSSLIDSKINLIFECTVIIYTYVEHIILYILYCN